MASLKEIPACDINEDHNDETYDMIYDQGEDEDKGMTLESEPSTQDAPNAIDTIKTALVIDSNDEIEATEKLVKD